MNQLNTQFETMVLICLCPWDEDKKNLLIDEIDALGIDGKDFYNRNYRLVEQYYHTFEKYIITSLGSSLMHEMDDIAFAMYASILQHNPKWFSEIDAVSEDVIQDVVNKTLNSEFSEYYDNVDEDLIAALDKSTLTDRAKWQIIVLQQRPKQQLKLVISAINENIPAYEKAYSKVENELENLLQHFNKSLSEPNKTSLLRLPEQVNANTIIFPTLALPMAIMILDDICFYGLMNHKLSTGKTELTKDELLIRAKALSEKSKIEILLSLKEQSRYNLEIAELIGLTPATVSHHMNSLLTSGFVELEKKDGKVYYKLSQDEIKYYLAGVKKLFLS